MFGISKTVIGLIVAGVGALLELAGIEAGHTIMLAGMGFAGVIGASHRAVKGEK